MIFTPTPLKGSYLIQPEKRADDRGYFARVWCQEEFAQHGIDTTLIQVNIGYSQVKGTLRGMHFQRTPHAEVKLVRCTRGSVYDVMLDLRPDSRTHGQWFAAELTAENAKMLFIPEGFAHGYQTLTNDSEISYQTSRPYAGDFASGVRHNDPAFGIDWPLTPERISEADLGWPDYDFKATQQASQDSA